LDAIANAFLQSVSTGWSGKGNNSAANLVELLLKQHGSVNPRDLQQKWTTPLHHAAKHNLVQLARLLLKDNATVDAKDTDWYATPLHYAAEFNSPEVAQLLLEHNASVIIDAVDRRHWTVLHYAARYNSTGVAQLLLEHNANVDALTKGGKSALDLAEESHSTAIVKLLDEQK